MTDVQPSVSTDGRLRTMAFFRAILLVPRARQVVMTAGRPDGEQRPPSSEPPPVRIRLPHHEPARLVVTANGRHTFRNGGDSQRHGDLEVVDRSSQPAATVDRVVEVAHIDGPHSHTDDTDDLQTHGEGAWSFHVDSPLRQDPPGRRPSPWTAALQTGPVSAEGGSAQGQWRPSHPGSSRSRSVPRSL